MEALQSRALSLILHQLPVNTQVPLKIETIRHRVFSNRIQIDFFERANIETYSHILKSIM